MIVCIARKERSWLINLLFVCNLTAKHSSWNELQGQNVLRKRPSHYRTGERGYDWAIGY